MKFQIFRKISEIHFDHDGFDDYDGDNGEYLTLDIDDNEVCSDITQMVYNDYFKDSMHDVDSAQQSIMSLLDDIEAWESVKEIYRDALRDMYEEKYGNN